MKNHDRQIEKLSRAVEQSPVTVMITDASGRIEYVNRWFTQLTGYTREETLGKNPRILQSGKTPRETYQRMWETIASGREWRGELLNKKKNGDLYWESICISALKDPQGAITHYIGVLDDVTDRKKLDQLKNEFVGVISHELRTPLAVISWSIEDLKDSLKGNLTDDQKKLIEGIQRNCERLKRVVNETLDLSRLESGKALLKPEPIDLIPLLKESVQNFQEQARRSGIAIEEDFPPNLPRLEADPDLVIQLTNNLLENAVRFARGRVIVRAGTTEGAVQVSVLDDGPGIPEGDQKRLFSKFEQIKRPDGKGAYKGTGLGLSICKEIVDQHRGKIWVESKNGQGAGFHYRLPSQSQTLGPSQTQEGKQETPYEKTREDHPHYRG